MSNYPIIINSHIYQYGDDVFVWYDEAGMVGGASNLLEEAKRQLEQYSIWLSNGVTQVNHERSKE